jgi:hypothetical protein
MPTRRIPLWLKIGYTLWVIAWIILYARFVTWQHYLWLCHLGNVVIVIGLWTENGLLLSWQALSLLFADLVWTIDFLIGLTFGQTPLGSAWYMFAPEADFPRLQKALALFHLFLPMLLIWCVWRFGYDRRALWLQVATCVIIFPISFLVSAPDDNINWVYGPFGNVQHTVSPPLYLLAAIPAYLLVLYGPSHLLLCLLAPRPRGRTPLAA